MPVIRLSNELHQRLAKYAKGFDTPANVIERLLNEKENITSVPDAAKPSTNLPGNAGKPELRFYPNESEFKQALVQKKPAAYTLHYTDGTSSEKVWNVSRFSEKSSLRGNIWSGPLRGWKEAGIVTAEFTANV